MNPSPRRCGFGKISAIARAKLGFSAINSRIIHRMDKSKSRAARSLSLEKAASQ
jgi:hypothetical protein